MRWGVTYTALIFNIMLTMELFLLTRQLLALLVALPVHGVCMLLCAREARFFDLLLLWAKTRLPGLIRSIWFWRASTYSPLHLDFPADMDRRALMWVLS
jgi:type IV secretion system protein VirB3